MKTHVKNALFVLVIALLFASCSSKSAPPPAPAAAVVQPAPEAAQPAQPAAAAGFDGAWTGESSPERPVSFHVANNQVTDLNMYVTVKNGGCTFSGSLSSEAPAPISGKSFTVHGRYEKVEFTLNGTFTSATEASGAAVWKGDSGICGNLDAKFNWTAKKGPADAAPDSEDDE